LFGLTVIGMTSLAASILPIDVSAPVLVSIM
jgi:hypothetical protein